MQLTHSNTVYSKNLQSLLPLQTLNLYSNDGKIRDPSLWPLKKNVWFENRVSACVRIKKEVQLLL